MEILQSRATWLNDCSMAADQQLICKKLEEDDDYQSVLKIQKHQSSHYRVVGFEVYH